MPVTALGAAVAAVALAAAASAGQTRPDLSGTWKAAPDAPAGSAAAPSPVFGERFSIQHAGDTFTIVRPQREGTLTARFTLDGRETRLRVTGPLCQADVETVEKAAWEGDAIAHTIVGAVPPGGGAVSPRNIKRLFRLQTADTLLVESSMLLNGQPRQVATVYKRSTEPLAAVESTPVTGPAATIGQLAWLPGVWSGTSGQTTTEERWTPASGGSSIGVSRTMRSNVMSAFEFLCIVERGGTLIYSAMPNGRSPATHFTLTSIASDAVTFENPAHDFPKIIRYTKRADGSLETMVAGAGGARAQTVALKKLE